MRRIIVLAFAAIALSLGLAAPASAAPANSNWGGWFYNQTVTKADGTTDVYQINATVNQTKTGKAITGSTVKCTYLQDPDPNSGAGTWQDWVVRGTYTSSTANGDPVFTGTTQEELRQFCLANAYKAV